MLLLLLLLLLRLVRAAIVALAYWRRWGSELGDGRDVLRNGMVKGRRLPVCCWPLHRGRGGGGGGRIFLVWGEAAPECPRWTNIRGTVTERSRDCRARGKKVDVEAPSGVWRCVLLEIPKCCHFSQQFPGQPRGTRLNVGSASHPTLSCGNAAPTFMCCNKMEASSSSRVLVEINYVPAFPTYLHDLALALQVIKCLPTLRFLDLPFTSSCACRPSAQVAKHRQSAPVILSNKWMVGQSSAAKTRSHFAFHMAPKAPNQTKSYHKTAAIRRTQGMPLGPPAYP